MLSCYMCKENKSEDCFYVSRTTKKGYTDICKTCSSEKIKKDRKENPEKYKKYHLNKPEEIRKEYNRKAYWKNVEETREKRRLYSYLPERREKRKELDKRYREKNKERIAEMRRMQIEKHKENHKARTLFQHQVRIGKIIPPTNCECCGKNDKLEGHHEDYKKPLEVIWLCTLCHGEKHRKYKEENYG